MAVEIEAKMAIDDFAALQAALVAAGAKRLGAFFEVNSFFDTEDRTLMAADTGLRIRLNRNTETGEEEHIITFKGPLQQGPLKSREEIELSVGSSTEAVRLFAVLGYKKTLSFEKHRESFELDRCRVELDEVPHLGRFVEIEGPDDAAVFRVREKLKLQGRPLIRSGYVAMLTGYVQEHGLRVRDIRFA